MMDGDLISRRALLAEYDRVHVGPPGGARKLIEEAPAADAVQVGRCKDCKSHTPATDKFMGWCELARIETRPNDYCRYRERKDNETD